MTTLLDSRYPIDAIRGTGPRTTVAVASDSLLYGQRALKWLNDDMQNDLGARQRFLTEARSLASVTHPNVVRIYDLVHSDERGPVMVLELARGPLREVEPAWPLSPRRATEVMDQMLSGLGVLHGLGVVHRDLRPEGLLIGRTGAVLIGDLSAAHLEGESRIMETMAGEALSDGLYAAPEARAGSRGAVAASDIYSAGAILYVLLTGNAPPDLSLLDFDDRILGRIPEAFRPVIKRATARKPTDRYPSAGAMRSAVQGLL